MRGERARRTTARPDVHILASQTVPNIRHDLCSFPYVCPERRATLAQVLLPVVLAARAAATRLVEVIACAGIFAGARRAFCVEPPTAMSTAPASSSAPPQVRSPPATVKTEDQRPAKRKRRALSCTPCIKRKTRVSPSRVAFLRPGQLVG